VLRLWVFAVLAGCGGAQRFTSATSTVYVRSDTDRTTVVTPKVATAADVADDTNVAASVEVDAWTGASVDVVTAATPAITEYRTQADVAVTRPIDDVRLNVAYRYSTEPDYTSHGGVLGARLELAQKNTTLGLDLLASRDTVGRADDPFFARSVWSAGVRAQVTQILDKRTLVELAWETIRIDGYQASPYRFVAIGGSGTCAGTAAFCVPEQVPDERWRNALIVRGRRALSTDLSAGLEYRFYVDDWGIQSHAIQPDTALRVTDSSVLELRYRYYTQSDASFYRPRYFDFTERYVTRDRKLSASYTHEAGLSYLHRVEICNGAREVVLGGRTTVSRLDYLAFIGLDHVWAFELTVLAGISLL
jgi:Protein of unknown function (DUF3570)